MLFPLDLRPEIRDSPPMQIAKGTVASIHYKVATADGEHVDASKPGEPMPFLCGTGQIISGLEDALMGKRAGDAVSVEIPPERAYGVRDPDLDMAVPIAAFPEDVRGRLRAGMQFQAPHPSRNDEVIAFTIHGLRGEDVLVSGNHPLADKTLHFEVTIDSVRAATREEAEHGHAHGPHGHAHH